MSAKSRLYFISGLPRSGSTLLAALLRQNPRFNAGISSPLYRLFTALIGGMSGEGRTLLHDDQRKRILTGLLDSWVESHSSPPVLFDTNRGWTSTLPALLEILPDTKILCTVRSVADIMDSIERLVRASPLINSRLFDDIERANVYTRTEALSKRNRLVGGAWCALKEAYYSPLADALLLIEYEHLARSPRKVMSCIYSFLDQPEYQHDFENVIYEESEFDDTIVTPNMHKVRPRVGYESRATVLPPDLFASFSNRNFWSDNSGSKAFAISLAKASRLDSQEQSRKEWTME